MHVYANGILPNNSYDKHSVTVRNTTSFLQDRMTPCGSSNTGS